MARTYETSISYTSPIAYFSSDEKKWINRIRKLQEAEPDLVGILCQPEENDGTIYATVPSNWLKISPPRHVTFTDEQREAMKERLKKARESSMNTQDDEEDGEEED